MKEPFFDPEIWNWRSLWRSFKIRLVTIIIVSCVLAYLNFKFGILKHSK